MLTKRQQLTITHLKEHLGIVSQDDIIKYCVMKLKQPSREEKRKLNLTGKYRRKSKKYYREIILYYRRLHKPSASA